MKALGTCAFLIFRDIHSGGGECCCGCHPGVHHIYVHHHQEVNNNTWIFRWLIKLFITIYNSHNLTMYISTSSDITGRLTHRTKHKIIVFILQVTHHHCLIHLLHMIIWQLQIQHMNNYKTRNTLCPHSKPNVWTTIGQEIPSAPS